MDALARIVDPAKYCDETLKCSRRCRSFIRWDSITTPSSSHAKSKNWNASDRQSSARGWCRAFPPALTYANGNRERDRADQHR